MTCFMAFVMRSTSGVRSSGDTSNGTLADAVEVFFRFGAGDFDFGAGNFDFGAGDFGFVAMSAITCVQRTSAPEAEGAYDEPSRREVVHWECQRLRRGLAGPFSSWDAMVLGGPHADTRFRHPSVAWRPHCNVGLAWNGHERFFGGTCSSWGFSRA